MAEPVRKMPADWETASSSPDDDPFFYGYRLRCVRLPSGEEVEQQIPLTPEDLLDPQPGDVVGQSGPHHKLLHLLVSLLTSYYTSRDDILVTSDMKMLWGIPGLPEPAPDVAVIPDIRDKEAASERDSFDVVEEGTKPCLIVEVVSSKDSETRRNDYERKVKIYQEVGIPEYLILDPPTPAKKRLLMTGYRLGLDGCYRQIEPDADGCLLSLTTQLLFGVETDGRTLRVIDTATGERLLTEEEIKASHIRETEARKAAEERASRETEARKAAEERASREAEARKAAEAENTRLRTELARLRNS
jgi:Uma2 family endonuclease